MSDLSDEKSPDERRYEAQADRIKSIHTLFTFMYDWPDQGDATDEEFSEFSTLVNRGDLRETVRVDLLLLMSTGLEVPENWILTSVYACDIMDRGTSSLNENPWLLQEVSALLDELVIAHFQAEHLLFMSESLRRGGFVIDSDGIRTSYGNFNGDLIGRSGKGVPLSLPGGIGKASQKWLSARSPAPREIIAAEQYKRALDAIGPGEKLLAYYIWCKENQLTGEKLESKFDRWRRYRSGYYAKMKNDPYQDPEHST